ncbi:MAG: hypothetical protein GPJ54_01645 [Candidatus Heimdallarchaeota archaeon]|nr:hypothetical protein [Candidatus Heimdallarchaeota archaeon]
MSNWCLAENVLLAYSDTEILVQTSPSTFSIFDVTGLKGGNEIIKIEEYETEYFGDRELGMINNSIVHWQNGPGPNYVLHDLESGEKSGLPLKIEEIEKNNLTPLYSSLKFDDNFQHPRLIATANYNNWVAYGYHDAQEFNNHSIDRDYIIHTGNQEMSRTIFVENFTNFVPHVYSLSKDGKTLVLSTIDAGQGFVSFNLFTNQSWTYNEMDEKIIYGISVESDKVWFLEYNTENSNNLFYLKKMNLNTGSISEIGGLNIYDTISEFVVVNDYVFVITNANYSIPQILLIGAPLMEIIIAIIYL